MDRLVTGEETQPCIRCKQPKIFCSQSRNYISIQGLISTKTQTKYIEFIYELTQPSANATISFNKWPSRNCHMKRIIFEICTGFLIQELFCAFIRTTMNYSYWESTNTSNETCSYRFKWSARQKVRILD